MSDKARILFVCHGNICRSPLAEGVFRRIVQDAGESESFEIESAGTSGYHEGEAPDPRTCAEAATRGIILEHSARRIHARDFDRFDYVIAMDEENRAALKKMEVSSGASAKIRLLRSFDAEAAPGAEVPDPYYGGERGFADVHDMIERACRGLHAHIREAM
jgi:protein-tyrosine phosphatase